MTDDRLTAAGVIGALQDREPPGRYAPGSFVAEREAQQKAMLDAERERINTTNRLAALEGALRTPSLSGPEAVLDAAGKYLQFLEGAKT